MLLFNMTKIQRVLVDRPDNPQGFIDIMQRERECKVFLIQHAFPSVTYQEADVMLMDCAFKEVCLLIALNYIGIKLTVCRMK